MLYAYVNGIRQRAEKGLKGTCRCCNEQVRAYCGKYVVNHWKHLSNSQCSFAGKGETQWHIAWKDRFHQDWQEVIFFDSATGDKHIADVHTPNKVTIEFQNSPISYEEVRQRESFYEKMIWVVNASNFGISVFSIAEREIKRLYRGRYKAVEALEQDYRNEIKKLEAKLALQDLRIEQKLNEVEQAERRLEFLREEFDKHALKALASIEKVKHGSRMIKPPSLLDFELSGSIFTNLLEELNLLVSKKKALEAESEESLSSLNKVLQNDSSIVMCNEEFTSVSMAAAMQLARSGKANLLCFVRSTDIGNMFAKIEEVGSLDFLHYLTSKGEYSFFLSKRKFLKLEESLQEQRNVSLISISLSIQMVEEKVKDKTKQFYHEKVLEAEKRLCKAKEEYNKKVSFKPIEEKEILSEIEFLKDEINDAKLNPKEGLNERAKLIRAQSNNKYRINWNRRESIWRDATKPVFLDTGKELIQLLDHNTGVRHSYQKFIQHYSRIIS